MDNTPKYSKAKENYNITKYYSHINQEMTDCLDNISSMIPKKQTSILIGNIDNPTIPLGAILYDDNTIEIKTFIKCDSILKSDHTVIFVKIDGLYYPIQYTNELLPIRKIITTENYKYYSQKQELLTKFSNYWLSNAFSNIDYSTDKVSIW
jgi:hypothetical protein